MFNEILNFIRPDPLPHLGLERLKGPAEATSTKAKCLYIAVPYLPVA
jgi:hypothetical protein